MLAGRFRDNHACQSSRIVPLQEASLSGGLFPAGQYAVYWPMNYIGQMNVLVSIFRLNYPNAVCGPADDTPR